LSLIFYKKHTQLTGLRLHPPFHQKKDYTQLTGLRLHPPFHQKKDYTHLTGLRFGAVARNTFLKI
jgi:hypothetical protein